MFEWEYNLPLHCLINISKDKKRVEVNFFFFLGAYALQPLI